MKATGMQSLANFFGGGANGGARSVAQAASGSAEPTQDTCSRVHYDVKTVNTVRSTCSPWLASRSHSTTCRIGP